MDFSKYTAQQLAKAVMSKKIKTQDFDKYWNSIVGKVFPDVAKFQSYSAGMNKFLVLKFVESILSENPNISILNEIIECLFKFHYISDIKWDKLASYAFYFNEIYIGYGDNSEVYISFQDNCNNEMNIFNLIPNPKWSEQEKNKWEPKAKYIVAVFCSEILPLFTNITEIMIDYKANDIINYFHGRCCEKVTRVSIAGLDRDISMNQLTKFPNLRDLEVLSGDDTEINVNLSELKNLEIFRMNYCVKLSPDSHKHANLKKIVFDMGLRGDVEAAKTHVLMFKIKEYKTAGSKLEMIVDN